MKVSGTIDDDLHKWMKKKIEDGKFYNSSHVIQQGLHRLRADEESGSGKSR